MITSKIADQHLSRAACIYIRQSTQGQVRFNQESTERQYNLKNKAQSLGWSPERIRILDRDLGQSGARTTNREDFKTLVSDVESHPESYVEQDSFCTDWKNYEVISHLGSGAEIFQTTL